MKSFMCCLEHHLVVFFFLMCLFGLGYVGSLVTAQGFSSCSERGLLTICSMQAPHCNGFSCCGAQALGHAGFSTCGAWAQ